MKGKQGSANLNQGKKVMNEVLDILEEKSKGSLELARKRALSMRIESQRIREALSTYFEDFRDTTHPGILQVAYESVGGDSTQIMLIQAAMTLLSAAMDLHDDIIDESYRKNGKQTIYGKYGKNAALLVGDALLIEAFSLLNESIRHVRKEVSDNILNIVMSTLFEIGNAHVLESSFKGQLEVLPKDYWRVIRGKSSILAANVRIGAILGNGSTSELNALEVYGRNLGVLVYLREDFIDMFEPEELMNRIKKEVLPLPLLYALQDPKIKKAALKILLKRRISNQDALEIVDLVLRSRDVGKLKDYMNKLANEAMESVQASLRNPCATMTLKLLVEGSLEDIWGD